jgi:hypothetical protein
MGIEELREHGVEIMYRRHPGYSELFLKGSPNELCRIKQRRILTEYSRRVHEAGVAMRRGFVCSPPGCLCNGRITA